MKSSGGGAAIGCGVFVAITVAFLITPLSIAIPALIIAQRDNEAARFALLVQLTVLLIPAVVATALGALLTGVPARVLKKDLGRLRNSQIGAFFGALAPPLIVFLTLALPDLIQHGPFNPTVIAKLHLLWIAGLIASVFGAVVGLFAGATFGRNRT